MHDPLAAEVAAAAAALGLRPGDRVLVAASGGADSTALAALLAASDAQGLPLHLTLGHVDHGWRGPDEAAADLACVEALGARLGAPVVAAGPPAEVRRTEEAARAHRYAALAHLAREARCGFVATAHHRRDVAETVLLRLARGSGPRGLASIPARRPLSRDLELVRPLLSLAVERLRAYVGERRLPFRDDPTNADLSRDRARLRARLVSAAAAGLPVEAEAVEIARRHRARLDRAAAWVARALAPSLRAHPDAGAVEVSLADVARVPRAALALVLVRLGEALAAPRAGPWFTRRHVALGAELLGERGALTALDLPQRLALRRANQRLWLVRREPPRLPPAELSGEGRVRHGALEVSRRDGPLADATHLGDEPQLGEADWTPATRGPARARLDAAVAGPRVTVRRVGPKDVFVPLHRSRTVRVAEFLARAGVPAPLRGDARVVADGTDRVLWVVGHRVDARAAVSPTTRRVAVVEAAWAPLAGEPEPGPCDVLPADVPQTDVSSIEDFLAGGAGGAGWSSSTERDVVAPSLKPFLNSLIP